MEAKAKELQTYAEKIQLIMCDSDGFKHPHFQSTNVQWLREENKENLIKNDKVAIRTSDFNKFENLHIKEVAKKINKGKVLAKSIKVKANKHSYLNEAQHISQINDRIPIYAPLSSDANFEKCIDSPQNHGNCELELNNYTHKFMESPTRSKFRNHSFLQELHHKKIKRPKNRNSTQSLNILKDLVYKSTKMNLKNSTSNDQNSSINGALQTTQKRLESRDAVSTFKKAKQPVIILDSKANWNFTNREHKPNKNKLNSNRVSKRSTSMLNQDLMLDFAADQTEKDAKKTSYKSTRKSSRFINNKKYVLPSKYLKHKRSTMQQEDSNSIQPSKLKSIKQTLTDKFLEMVGLENLKNLEHQSGCIELEIEKIKHFKSSGYEKYSDAIFYVLDRLYKNKSTVIQRLYNLNTSQKSDNQMVEIPENLSLTQNEREILETTPLIKNPSINLNSTPSSMKMKNYPQYDSIFKSKNRGKQTINDIFKLNPSNKLYLHQENIDNDLLVCQYFNCENNKDMCIKGSKIQKQKFKLTSNEDESSSESFAKTTQFTFKRNKTRNSITNDLNQVENKVENIDSKLDVNLSPAQTPSK